jgi:transcriptional regulator GlxA family with amidase domain
MNQGETMIMTFDAAMEPEHLPASEQTYPQFHSSAASLPAAASQMLDEVRGALSHDLHAASLSATRLALLLRESVAPPNRRPPSKGGLASWQERKVRDHIDSNIDSSILVDDLADIVSLSAAHFCRAFKKSFEATPHAYIVRRRVERAQDLMRTTRSPLSQIALDCGFADQTHLSKLFRRLTGRTPNNWRRAHTMGL